MHGAVKGQTKSFIYSFLFK